MVIWSIPGQDLSLTAIALQTEPGVTFLGGRVFHYLSSLLRGQFVPSSIPINVTSGNPNLLFFFIVNFMYGTNAYTQFSSRDHVFFYLA